MILKEKNITAWSLSDKLENYSKIKKKKKAILLN